MNSNWQTLHTLHPRTWHDNRFVYPVLSRRSQGISIGINLNPDKVCNFDCIYCQVDRRSEAETRFVGIEQLLAEVDDMLERVTSGTLFEEDGFRDVPPEKRRLNDLAFSGDGEPTTYRNFDEIVSAVADLKRRRGLTAVKMVLITNASMLHRPVVQRGLSILDANQGEIWAKLEAGTDGYYQLVERTKIPFRQILDNITTASQTRLLVIQSLFMRIHGEAPPAEEISAFCARLDEILQSGGRLSKVQVYTVARTPTESFVTSLTLAELQAIADEITTTTGIPADVFP